MLFTECTLPKNPHFTLTLDIPSWEFQYSKNGAREQHATKYLEYLFLKQRGDWLFMKTTE